MITPLAPLRTLHLNTERTWRGGEKQTLNLVRELQQRGHVAELICPPGSPLQQRAEACGIVVHAIPSRGDLDPRAIYRIRQVMRNGDFDVVQMHTSHAHMLGVAARGLRRKPLTIVARRVDFSIHRKGGLGLNRLKYAIGVDGYIAISQAIRDVLVRDGVAASRIEVVYSGVDPLPAPARSRQQLRRELGCDDDSILIGNVAHFAQHKGQAFFLQALSQLHRRNPKVRGVLVGDGEMRASILDLQQRLEIEPALHLAGFQEDVSSYLSAFDIFVMPSLLEGLCTSILDALLKELPVVASRTGGIPEIILHEHTGLLADAGNAQSLEQQLQRLIDDPDLARNLAAAGRQRVEQHFSAASMAEGTLQVYRRLLAEKGNPAQDLTRRNS